ncbi:helix-turn-helix domain-containing protein [Actinosynnema sp. CS-041913]|uniref:helix-turn-helix domain-containing protein n=1 Tax=Actinosynnema sp. CS-041913 TaxID=3239917 RepID=UPI003D90395B
MTSSGGTGKDAAEEFGALLRRARKRKALTQEQVAERCDLGVRTIRRLEAGDFSKTRPATAQALADALGLAPDERDTFLSTVAVGDVRARVADDFGVLLRETRDRKALTQEALAERAAVGVRTVQRLEAGTASGLTVATLRDLADALGLVLGSNERDSFLRAAVDGNRTLHRGSAPGPR